MAPREKEEPEERERCITGIDGLDNILNGGIPRGNTVLITGSIGTGKTSLCLEFLVHGAIVGENSLYVSVTESYEKLLNNIIPYDFFDRKLIKDGRLVFIDLPVIYDKLGLEKLEFEFEEVNILVAAIGNIVDELNIKRLVIDSITSVCYRLKTQENIRDFILKLGSMLSSRGCTSLLVSEISPAEERYSHYGVEEAIADGGVVTGNLERRGDRLRTLQVAKMRGTMHSRALDVLEIPLDHIWFVDCISQIMMSAGQKHEHAIYVESPTMLENIMLKVEYLIRRTADRKNLVILDSINSLAIHNNTKILSEFLHILVNNLRAKEAYTIIFSMEEYETEDIRNMLNLVSDETV